MKPPEVIAPEEDDPPRALAPTDERPIVVVAGDWIVDDYLFLRPAQSQLASSTGLSHYECVSGESDLVRDLCGAGHVAQVLYQDVNADDHLGIVKHRLRGIGAWNARDTDRLLHLVHATKTQRCPVAQRGHSLEPTFAGCSMPIAEEDLQLHNLAPQSVTHRVVRRYTYRPKTSTIEQLERTDLTQRANIDDPNLPSWDESTLLSVSTVVVHDMGKGAVSSALIQYLRKCSNARWFVRSKLANPEWLQKVDDVLAFLLIGPGYS